MNKTRLDNSKIALIILGIIALFSIGCTTWCIIDFTLPPRMEIKDNQLIIHDTYSQKISLKDAKITISNEEINTIKRVAGTSSSSIRKGIYTLENFDNTVYISMMRNNEEYILIVSENKRYYINLTTPEKTSELYNNLLRITTTGK